MNLRIQNQDLLKKSCRKRRKSFHTFLFNLFLKPTDCKRLLAIEKNNDQPVTLSPCLILSTEPKPSPGELEIDSDDIGIVMREKRLVDRWIVKSGMLRFNFLLECCHPGTVPDPQLVAAMIQLVQLFVLCLELSLKNVYDDKGWLIVWYLLNILI